MKKYTVFTKTYCHITKTSYSYEYDNNKKEVIELYNGKPVHKYDVSDFDYVIFDDSYSDDAVILDIKNNETIITTEKHWLSYGDEINAEYKSVQPKN